jgi:hypothetical protein
MVVEKPALVPNASSTSSFHQLPVPICRDARSSSEASSQDLLHLMQFERSMIDNCGKAANGRWTCAVKRSRHSGMSRRILPLPEDYQAQNNTFAIPTREALERSNSIFEAEERLKQKGRRVMKPSLYKVILVYIYRRTSGILSCEAVQAAEPLLRLYASILLPVVVVSVWMFALCAALSYAVPTLLCISAVRSNPVRITVCSIGNTPIIHL